jgi:(1->4)-alpha-D-glucan 1-alpha-D-glucosylmutase
MAELRATYRLQLTAQQGFAQARSLVPYLRDLGISHLYLSPSQQARPGSPHGYDVIDPSRLSADLGGEPEFRELARAAHGAGLGLVLDTVPNHMAADGANRYWADPRLRSRFFDLDPVTGLHRRFFDVDGLAGLRQEDAVVFETTHELVLRLVREGLVDGLRIDHPDGLADPAGYLGQLHDAGVENVWVEKILDGGERLRDWPVRGTTGYEFLNEACGLFVDAAAEAAFTRLWRDVSGDRRPFGEIAHAAKLEQAQSTFSPEVERVSREHPALPREAVELALASLPVYRTYVVPDRSAVAPEDRAALAGVDPAVRAALLLEEPAPAAFITRFQQTTPPIMAKGIEDTAFYRYGRLLALNEVGGDPSRFGIGVEQLHAANQQRAERFPFGMLTTQTHDTKRSADVRARIAALSWMPDTWSAHVERWFALSEVHVRDGAPDGVERYFLFQTLAGAWPIEPERIQTYMLKALREAKRNSSWLEINEGWEESVARFTDSLLTDRAFMAELEPFCGALALAAARAACGALVLKLTSPGIPDIYQADELPYIALVDPDNRRPVDWEWSEATLGRLLGSGRPVGGLHKPWLILRLLGLRARRPEPFTGGYEPLAAGDATCAYLRGGDVLVAVHTRPGMPDAVLDAPGGRWRDVLSGDERSFNRREPLAELLGELGVAVFERI